MTWQARHPIPDTKLPQLAEPEPGFELGYPEHGSGIEREGAGTGREAQPWFSFKAGSGKHGTGTRFNRLTVSTDNWTRLSADLARESVVVDTEHTVCYLVSYLS